ncbi:MAG: YkgJ family cysteine cluster protein [Thioalkalivibrio sp.]|nr:YkgJ family cysteine cluster protein [Thioalkalivibrio sp.]
MSASIRGLRLSTICDRCTNKCCSKPYDWVYLTEEEISNIQALTGLLPDEFSSVHSNRHGKVAFRVLNLPCRFLKLPTGECTIYGSRPLVCKLFPFYPEPLTGHATLLPAQCGENLVFYPTDSAEGWTLQDFDAEVLEWLPSLWREAAERHHVKDHERLSGSNTRTAGSP